MIAAEPNATSANPNDAGRTRTNHRDLHSGYETQVSQALRRHLRTLQALNDATITRSKCQKSAICHGKLR